LDQHNQQLEVDFLWLVLMLGFEVASDGDDELINFSASGPTRPSPVSHGPARSQPAEQNGRYVADFRVQRRPDEGRRMGERRMG
jgi:hypothetical protein